MRAVFDTNIVISALVFEGHLAWLRAGWSSKRLIPLVNDPIADELRRVLAYPKFRLNAPRQQALLTEYLVNAEHRSPLPPVPEWAEACRDKSDVMFLALAASADVTLVTGDRVVAALEGLVPITVVSPRALLLGLQP